MLIVDSIEKLAASATQGNWGYNFGDDHKAQICTTVGGEEVVVARGLSREDAEYILALRRIAPTLLAFRMLLKELTK